MIRNNKQRKAMFARMNNSTCPYQPSIKRQYATLQARENAIKDKLNDDISIQQESQLKYDLARTRESMNRIEARNPDIVDDLDDAPDY